MGFEEIKERIRERCDIVDVVNRYVPLKKAGASWKACCPFHQEKTPSFHVNPQRQIFHCYGCHEGGDVFAFVMKHEGVDFVESMRILARNSGLPFDEDELRSPLERANPQKAREMRSRKELLYELHEKIATWFQMNLRSEVGRTALEYIRGRGLSDDELVRFGLGYAPDSWDAAVTWGQRNHYSPDVMMSAGILTVKDENDPRARPYDRFRNRLMFPIWNTQGQIVAFSGRALPGDDTRAKYVNSPETEIFHKGSVLYALPLARTGFRDHGFALICEGQLDVIACHAAGFDNAVAPQGTAFTEQQARTLKRFTNRIVLAFDADKAGRNAARKSVEVFLPAELTAEVVLLDAGEDPDSLVREQGPEVLKTKVESARDYFDFLLDCLCDEHDTKSPHGKGEISREFLEAVSKLDSPVLRADYCQGLALRLDVPEASVFQDMKAVVARRRRAQRYRDERYAAEPEPEATAVEKAASVRTANPSDKCIGVLLDIALHHENYARRLSEELPPEYIGLGPLAGALNEVLAHTAQGEWSEAETFLLEGLSGEAASAVTAVLVAGDFGPDREPEDVDQAYRESLVKIYRQHDEDELRKILAKLRHVEHRDERHLLQRQLMEAQGRINQLKRGELPARQHPS